MNSAEEKNQPIQVEVVYGIPTEQKLLMISVEQGTTVEQAINQSGIVSSFHDIDLSKNLNLLTN